MSNKIRKAIRKNEFYDIVRKDLTLKLRARRVNTIGIDSKDIHEPSPSEK